MREILFRGKRLDNGEWVHGYYELMVHLPGTIEEEIYPVIHPSDDHRAVSQRVDPATVGQYTGLKDKNGKRIFEGDIVKIVGDGADCIQEEDRVFTVDYLLDDYDCGFNISKIFEYEVIGNIHDNKNLLKNQEVEG